MKCPYCKVSELQEEEDIEYGDCIDDMPLHKTWLECPNCHAQFDDEEEVRSAIDDIEQEKALKHEEYQEPYWADSDREMCDEYGIPYGEHDD